MSQKAQQDQDRRRAPTQKVKTQDTPITGLSPDDDIGVDSGNTGKPPAPPDPTPTP
ncbi:MAG TPA: hypothetical protein VF516_01385 [Kofleriaceae bacterium]